MVKRQHKLLSVLVTLAYAPMVWAQLPTGGVVGYGAATITNVTTTHQQINQTTDRAIINGTSFSIGADSRVEIIQPSTSAVLLYRVTGSDPSNIFGSLSATGQLFLVNPNGIYFAPGSRLDVGGLVASTLNIKDSDFIAGRNIFSRESSSVARAEVINQGILKAREGGYVVLAGDYAANRGVIEARLGTVMLGSANQITLDIVGDKLVNYTLNERNVTALAGVANSGQLLADGGRVVMTASTARTLVSEAVNNSGVIQARGVEERNGAVYLLADDAPIVLTGTSSIDVSGAKGGGTVLVGGNYQGGGTEARANAVIVEAGSTINANATSRGDGGKVVVWSDGKTQFDGSISARGGSQGGNGGVVEVSGLKQLGFTGTVDTRAPQGKTGTLLLDPADVEIRAQASTTISGSTPFTPSTNTTTILNIATLNTALANSDVTVLTGTTAGGTSGNITIFDAVSWSTANTLTLTAANQILINNTVTGSNANSALILNASGGVTQTSAIVVGKLGLQVTGSVTLQNAGNAFSTVAGSVTGATRLVTTTALDIGTVGSTTGLSTNGNLLNLNVGGALTQQANANVSASSVAITSSSGVVTLDNAGNTLPRVAVSSQAATSVRTSGAMDVTSVDGVTGVNSHGNNVTLQSGGALTLTNAVTAMGSTLTLNAGSGMTQSTAVTASVLKLLGSGTATLSNSSNSFGTLLVDYTGDVSARTNSALVLGDGTGAINTHGSRLTTTVAGNLTQSDALTVGGLAVVSSGGTVTLTNANNAIGSLALVAVGDTTLTLGTGDTYITTLGSTTGISLNNNNNLTINVGTGTLYFGQNSTAGTTNIGSGTLTLNANSTGQVRQYTNAAITADKLVVSTDSYVGLSDTANSVNTLVMSASGDNNSGSAFDFKNNKAIVIGTAGTVGIDTSASNSSAKVTAYGNISLANNVTTGTGTLGLLAKNGESYYDVGNSGFTITAGALAVAGGNISLDKNADGVNNSTGTKILTKKIAIDTNGSFAYTAANELTVGNYMGINGINAGGNVYIKTGEFAASGSFGAYNFNSDYSTYYDASSGKYRAGLMLDSGIRADATVYLDSASGVFQWANDLSGTTSSTTRSQAKISASNLILTGKGQFSLLMGQNSISNFAAAATGSILLADSSPLTINQLSFNGFGASSGTITGVHAIASSTPTSGSVAGGDAQYNPHSILLSAGDNPGDSSNVAMTIAQNIVADSLGSATINLSVGASDTHKDALVQTTGSAVIQGNVLVLGANQNRGTFSIKTNVSSLSAAGGQSMYIDNSLQTGALNVLGIGTQQGGGSPTPVGNFFLTTAGDMLVIGGKSAGTFMQLRGKSIDIFGAIDTADGASILLQPYDLTSTLGVHNDPANDVSHVSIATNFTRSSLHQFGQTATIYVGSTPNVMAVESVPAAVRSLKMTGDIRIGSDASGGLQFGYRSLSAQTEGTIWAGYLGDVYNLRFIAPTVSVQGFNVTGNQLQFLTNNLSLTTDASNYKVVTQKGDDSNTLVTLGMYSTGGSIYVGDTTLSHGNDPKVQFTEALLKKFPDYTNFMISGTVDVPMQNIDSTDIQIYYPDFSIENRKLNLSVPKWVYLYYNTKGDNNVYGHDSYGLSNGPSYISSIRSGPYTTNNASSYTAGQGGGYFVGCPSLSACQLTNSSNSTGNTNPSIPPVITTGGGANTCVGNSCSNSSNKPPDPSATPPSDPTTTTIGNVISTNPVTNTGTGDGTGTGNTNPTGTTPDPNAGMDDGGPSGPSPNNGGGDPTSGGGDPTSGSGDPTSGSGTPTSGSGSPGNSSGDPTSGGDTPSTSSGAPGNGSADPTSGSGDSTSGSGTPTSGSGTPSSGSGDPSTGNGNGSNGGNGATTGSGTGSGSGNNGDTGGTDSVNGNNTGAGTGSTNNTGEGTGSGGTGNNTSGSGNSNAGNGTGSGTGSDSGAGNNTGAAGADDGASGAGSGNGGANSGSSGSGTGNTGGGDSGSGDGTGTGGTGNGGAGSGNGTGSGDANTGGAGANSSSGGAADASGSSGSSGQGNGRSGSGAGDSGSGAGNTGSGTGGSGTGGAASGNGSGDDSGDSVGTGSKAAGTSNTGAGDSGTGTDTTGTGNIGSTGSGAPNSGNGDGTQSDSAANAGNKGGNSGNTGASDSASGDGAGTSGNSSGSSSSSSGGGDGTNGSTGGQRGNSGGTESGDNAGAGNKGGGSGNTGATDSGTDVDTGTGSSNSGNTGASSGNSGGANSSIAGQAGSSGAADSGDTISASSKAGNSGNTGGADSGDSNANGNSATNGSASANSQGGGNTNSSGAGDQSGNTGGSASGDSASGVNKGGVSGNSGAGDSGSTDGASGQGNSNASNAGSSSGQSGAANSGVGGQAGSSGAADSGDTISASSKAGNSGNTGGADSGDSNGTGNSATNGSTSANSQGGGNTNSSGAGDQSGNTGGATSGDSASRANKSGVSGNSGAGDSGSTDGASGQGNSNASNAGSSSGQSGAANSGVGGQAGSSGAADSGDNISAGSKAGNSGNTGASDSGAGNETSNAGAETSTGDVTTGNTKGGATTTNNSASSGSGNTANNTGAGASGNADGTQTGSSGQAQGTGGVGSGTSGNTGDQSVDGNDLLNAGSNKAANSATDSGGSGARGNNAINTGATSSGDSATDVSGSSSGASNQGRDRSATNTQGTTAVTDTDGSTALSGQSNNSADNVGMGASHTGQGVGVLNTGAAISSTTASADDTSSTFASSGAAKSQGATRSSANTNTNGNGGVADTDTRNAGSGQAQSTATDSGANSAQDSTLNTAGSSTSDIGATRGSSGRAKSQGANTIDTTTPSNANGDTGTQTGRSDRAKNQGAAGGGGNNSNSNGAQSAASDGGSSSGGNASAGAASVSEGLCIGQQQTGQRGKELPEQGGSLATRPLVEVRNGGLNLDSDCSRQSLSSGGGSSSSVGGRK